MSAVSLHNRPLSEKVGFLLCAALLRHEDECVYWELGFF